MAVTGTPSGTISLAINFKNALTGDIGGEEATNLATQLLSFLTTGADPTLSGWLQGIATCAAGDWLMAHATDPLQAMGSATYCQGFTVAGTKLKFLFIKNLDTTNTITVARKSSTGLAIFDTAGDSVTIKPGGIRFFYDPTGITAALTTGSNDGLTISVGAGAPTCYVLAVYGP